MLTGGCWEKEWGFPWKPFSSGAGGRWRIPQNMSSSHGVRVQEPLSACYTDISSHRKWAASYLPNASVTFIWWNDPKKESESKCLSIRYTHENWWIRFLHLSKLSCKWHQKTCSNMLLTATAAVSFACNSKELRNKNHHVPIFIRLLFNISICYRSCNLIMWYINTVFKIGIFLYILVGNISSKIVQIFFYMQCCVFEI